MLPFATSDDLTERGISVTDVAVADQLLSDVSEHLRSVIGQQVFPQSTSTFSVWVGCGTQWVSIPLNPLIDVSAASVDDTPVEVVRQSQSIRVIGPGRVDITCTHGFTVAPAELVSWTCVVASQVLAALAELGSLGFGEVANISIDDYRKGFNQAADRGAFSLPQNVEDRLAASYGGGSYVTKTLT